LVQGDRPIQHACRSPVGQAIATSGKPQHIAGARGFLAADAAG